jgi:hypothetical protein
MFKYRNPILIGIISSFAIRLALILFSEAEGVAIAASALIVILELVVAAFVSKRLLGEAFQQALHDLEHIGQANNLQVEGGSL